MLLHEAPEKNETFKLIESGSNTIKTSSWHEYWGKCIYVLLAVIWEIKLCLHGIDFRTETPTVRPFFIVPVGMWFDMCSRKKWSGQKTKRSREAIAADEEKPLVISALVWADRQTCLRVSTLMGSPLFYSFPMKAASSFVYHLLICPLLCLIFLCLFLYLIS